MDHEVLYDAIFHRRSVRKYDNAPLTEEALAQLQEFIGALTPLKPEIKTEIKLLRQGEIKTNAPHAVCLYSEEKEGHLMNAGFLMEQIDLYLSSKNIGACWLGLTKPDKNKVSAPAGMSWAATLCFGTPAQPMHREEISQFNRKRLNEISDITDLFHILEAVRIAPSSQNMQPWYYGGTAENIIVSRKKNLLFGKMNQIDIGISLCCFYLSAKHQGKEMEFSFEPATVPEKQIFMANIKIV